jgi:hypothetical protein
MLANGEDPDAELHEKDIISPWYIRKRLGMSQQQFPDTLGIPIAILRNWEQKRAMMGARDDRTHANPRARTQSCTPRSAVAPLD